MGKSFSIPLIYKDGSGNLKLDTGKTVTLRESPYTSDLYTLSETNPGVSGIYKHDDVDDKVVRLYVNGTYKSDYGTFRTYGDLANMLEPYFKRDGSVAMTGEFNGGDFRMHHIGDPVSGIDVGDRDYNDARYLQLGGSVQTITKQVLFSTTSNIVPSVTAPTTTGIPTATGHLTSKYYVDTEISKSSPLLLGVNQLLVDANRESDIDGKVYNTIQKAIDYAKNQPISGTSRWTIFIVPHKNSSNYTGYAEALTMYKFIDLIGLGMVMMKCLFTYSGVWTGGTYARLKNLVVRPAVDTNLTIRGIEADNCHFGVHEDNFNPVLSLESSQFSNCGFWKFTNTSEEIATTGGNYIMNCIGNSSITWDSSDSVWGYDYINDTSKYFKIT